VNVRIPFIGVMKVGDAAEGTVTTSIMTGVPPFFPPKRTDNLLEKWFPQL